MKKYLIGGLVFIAMPVFILLMCLLKVISAFIPDGTVGNTEDWDATQTAVYESVKEATEDWYDDLWKKMSEEKKKIIEKNTVYTPKKGADDPNSENGTEIAENEYDVTCNVTVTVRMNYLGDAYLIAYLSYSGGLDEKTASIDKNKAEAFLTDICTVQTKEDGDNYEVTNSYLSVEEIADKYFTEDTDKQEFEASCYAYSQFFEVSDAKVEDADGEDAITGGDASLLEVPLYLQYDSKWAAVAYGNGKIKDTGCCPTCLAMVFSYLKQKNIYPTDVVNWCGNKYYVNGSGTGWSIFDNTYAVWGVSCTSIGKSEKLMVEALREGKPIIASMGPGHFTKGGHFIVLSGITADGKIKVKDPNDSLTKNHVNTDFEVSLILRECKNMWVCK